ncbi:MAG: DUF1178 family protein [Candidatus Pelagibacter sp. TMED286]|nr:MAG: DUF1178 family protein [Candidatus Pelagibacter sp. TMED286]|tara:strand:- start:483 stop:905 length:423 start_codon:yes stop_codon:yes gene_type:complete
MIKYNLKCENDHEFESWFSNSEEFEKLKKKNLLECIFCSTKKITKSIMAPMISNLKNKGEDIDWFYKERKNERIKLLELRKYIENNFEHVSDNFSKKVREVYYDKKSKKAIYGKTTPQEREELAEEGINLLSVPWVNKDN